MTRSYPFYVANAAESPNADLEVRDKYSGEIAARVALAGAADIERAIQSAYDARGPMRAFPPHARRQVLETCALRFRERAEELAQILAVEAGKPLRDARGEITRLVETFQIAAEEAVRIGGEVLSLGISPRTAGTRGMTKRTPVGAVSFITPFNFPLNLVAHKVAPAIAAGCPFVLKPSDKTPISALVVGEILATTDLPKGAFSILPVPLDHVAPFIEDSRFALLSFTGSGKVGWGLKARAGRKKVTLELGGNAACIVDENPGQSLDAIVDRLVFGAFYQSGQSCISVQRIFVHEARHAELLAKLVAKTQALVAGDPKDELTFLGPMIDEAAAKRLEGWIKSAEARGATVLCGGKRTGAMLEATLVTGVPDDEPLSADEAFGPVAIVEAFAEWKEAVARVNASDFGLQAGVFTGDLGHALGAWDDLDVSGVVVGDVPSFRVDNMPYGGTKGSGIGREGVRYAIEDMTDEKLLVIRNA